MSNSAGKVGMAAFNVVKKSNKGVKLELTLPDGTPTEEYLVVGGQDSTKFRGQQAKANRERVKAVRQYKDDPVKMAEFDARLECRLVASLVVGWSFEEECNETNVMKFLSDAPQIQMQIDQFAGDRANFFEKPPQS